MPENNLVPSPETRPKPSRTTTRRRKSKKKTVAPRLRIIPLGGLGQIGKNMMALECGDDIIVIDAGIMFPSEEMIGVDTVIPDMSYLVENRTRVRGLVITHGHEDHIGAVSYLLSAVNVPVYATKLSTRLIAMGLKQKGSKVKAQVNEVAPGEVITLGCMTMEMFPVCHSIPDAVGLIIETPLGTIVHTGDFKLDHNPVIGEPTDLHRLALVGSKQVLLLLSDSTYAELPGYTPPEQTVADSLDRIVMGAKGRVIVATFSSLVARIQQVMDIAAKYKRHVFVTGRSMEGIVKVTSEIGYLNVPPRTVSKYEQIHNLPPDKVVILTTGTQGEPTSALVRMGTGEHPHVKIREGDTVVMSATPIPGNEQVVSKTINNLFRLGANVVYGSQSRVHVHGHGSEEELKTVFNLVRPKFFIPVHGEYRHLAKHAKIAEDMGIPRENIFVLDNGDVLELDGTKGKVVDKVPAGDFVANGPIIRELDVSVMRDRRLLSRDGVVFVTIVISPTTGRLEGEPVIVSKGFVDPEEYGELLEGGRKAVASAVALGKTAGSGRGAIEARARETLARYLYEKTHRKPVIIPVVTGL
ncbi:MAG: ribonuclease J [Dehalococcoidia bacterium]|nr:ribonuclease J [Dehalococcoidia bacterium]